MSAAAAFFCPTRILQNEPLESALAPLVQGRRWALVTSAGWLRRGLERRLPRHSKPAIVVADVPENPRWSYVRSRGAALPPLDAIVAVGGGSVLDSAKAFAALAARNDESALLRHLRDGEALPEALAPARLIAAPTTSGTGSEVTRWGTVWGDDGAKYSVSHPSLYPAVAILDASLCATMPQAVTLASGLDALSHAMEAVWNRRHGPLTDALAESAIATLRRCLEPALRAPADLSLRREMQGAALLAGLAMGTTQTALAHSISYPFTAHYGLPHGLACSFTLAEVARYNGEQEPARLAPIARGLGVAPDAVPQAITDWLRRLGVGALLARHASVAALDALKAPLTPAARAGNNLRDADEAGARALARRSLEALLP